MVGNAPVACKIKAKLQKYQHLRTQWAKMSIMFMYIHFKNHLSSHSMLSNFLLFLLEKIIVIIKIHLHVSSLRLNKNLKSLFTISITEFGSFGK